jgi:hypothetical protein
MATGGEHQEEPSLCEWGAGQKQKGPIAPCGSAAERCVVAQTRVQWVRPLPTAGHLARGAEYRVQQHCVDVAVTRRIPHMHGSMLLLRGQLCILPALAVCMHKR